VFIPEGPVDLPPGSVLEIPLTNAVPPHTADRPLAQLAQLATEFPDDPEMPTDAAAQHDHYLYGLPKRP
jgi:hypothetical protein